jgi:hypothetical protein
MLVELSGGVPVILAEKYDENNTKEKLVDRGWAAELEMRLSWRCRTLWTF